MAENQRRQQQRLTRRTVLTGVGVAGGTGLLGQATAAPARAAAQPGSTAGPAMPPTGFKTISSPPEPNVSYQFRAFWDFFPGDDMAAGRVWGGNGVYTNKGADQLITTFDAEPGAVLHDIEWYVANTSAVGWGIALWGAGQGTGVQLITGALAAGTGAITATRVAIPSATNGPFPAGSRIAPFIGTPTDGSVQVNGVRLGFTLGGLQQVMRPSTTRVYDSRAHTRLPGGASRTIPLATWLPAGAQAVTLALTVLNTHGSGALHVAPAGGTSVAFAATWARTGDRSTSTVISDVSLSRAVTVSSQAGSGVTDFVLDLIGWVV
jgi:hypothetical protein